MAENRPILKAHQGGSIVERSTSSTDSQETGGSGSDTPELAHERHANTRIPVTPGINLSTYRAQHSPAVNDDVHAPSYFTRDPAKQDRRLDLETAASTLNLLKGAMTSQEVLRRMSLSLRGRRESLTEIKNAAPDLALSGNVISATFVTPHNIKYHKGGEWVGKYGRGLYGLGADADNRNSDTVTANLPCSTLSLICRPTSHPGITLL